jgi:tRNA-guanine family transglycosylase
LYQAGEALYVVLATHHNLRRYLDIMREIRQAIQLGTFPEYLKVVRAIPVEAE